MTGAVLRRLRTPRSDATSVAGTCRRARRPRRATRRKTAAGACNRWFLWFVVALLALNWLSLLLVQPNSQPARDGSLQRLSQRPAGGEIKSISAKADGSAGNARKKVRYPADSKTATPTALFATQVPPSGTTRS